MTVIISDAGVQFPDASVQPSALTTGTQTIAGAKTFSGNATFSGLSGHIKSGTAVTASGTSVDFTGIPASIKRITLMLGGVSTNGVSALIVRIGSGSIDSTGYQCSCNTWASGLTDTTGFIVTAGFAAVDLVGGSVIITRVSGDTWSSNSNVGGGAGGYCSNGAGYKALSGELDRIRLTTSNGTDTFDAGSVNILYEG